MADALMSEISYNATAWQALMEQYKSLSSFSQVSEWDGRAQVEVDKIVSALQEVDKQHTNVTERLSEAQRAREKQPYLKRLFSGGKEEQDLSKKAAHLSQVKTELERLAGTLQEAIDFTPNSAAEQKALLKELRLRKKELQIEKREITAAMRAVSTKARQQSADAGVWALGTHGRRMVAAQRRSLRYSREAALKPHESERAAIERQIVQIDRDILWAERVGNSESE